jgi:hypothetical protein
LFLARLLKSTMPTSRRLNRVAASLSRILKSN